KLYFKIYSEYPKEEISHCGMECASIKKKINDLEIISIGSIIKKYHTVEEVTYISSWIKTFHLLIELLEIL
ncbi:MAG: aminoacyl-histidine dipeptidase, partial [Bacilli bacterium]|nr:aminoacyl-histidine dipeptidase [Bacilli bacterium]